PTKRKRKRGSDAVDMSSTDPTVRALELEPPPEEMPAIEPARAAVDASITAPSGDDETRRRRKRSKADVAAERDEEIAAAIEATAQPSVIGDELSPSVIRPPP